ncbi:uncharacterized protein LOC113534513 isoform X1 [Pangasianodon hypophthalmus]|uniref:uncharacterized protein LOC113534513 isoform X1 n=1 Tax=Pangasianodon hypophthalmus TaxID=310915 RepID=UPI00230701B3|nr:uncharacterized protein LOC113534513 isoform X1 [Pangasianodon hypophthalmus]
MSKPQKSHKAMGDQEWMSRLRQFASTGVWPSEAGNRPAPRQKKWYDLFQRIDKCPAQARGQTSLFGGVQSCLCGFHLPRGTSDQPASTSGAAPTPTSAQTTRRPPLNISMFTKPRFGGTHSAAAKPNVNIPRRKLGHQSSSASSPLSESASPSPSASVTAGTHPSSTLKASSFPPSTVRASPSPSESVRASPSPSESVRASPSPSESVRASPSPSESGDPITSAAPSGVPTSAPPAPDDGSGSVSSLPPEMRKTIPLQDQRWIASTLYHGGRLRSGLKLWYEPPVPSLIYHQAPLPDRFFTHRLLVWMPYHLWKVRLFCPVCGKQLTGYGIHKRARRVLDIDRYYLMVTETLRCTVCRLNYISTSQTVLNQLDLPHRALFRVILTYKYACDIRVIRLLRERTLGNSPTRLARQLKENHGEEWLHHLAHYMEECAVFADRPSFLPVAFQEPPQPIEVPTSKWLLTVYGKDIISRLDHIKASITSTFGTILKMDSTKKITKKLAGHARGTAQWMSSVSNERGQILISVLTAQEGPGLDSMVSGLVSRYQQAGVAPPVLLYVDSGCCIDKGQSKLQTRFGGWPDLNIRLDIWHFMRRLATGCSTDAHPLYPTFMARLSACIFEWDPHDVTLLRRAKREQLEDERLPLITDDLVNRRISKKELALYCRRRTRGVETTVRLIDHLLQELKEEKGRDLMGVPLLDTVRMEYIWHVQKRHVKCIQDVPGVSLYTETGTTTTKGGIVLTRYRCARGSTSLESFHCHMQRFIPGTSANTLNFQLYLLEGLNRWNQDRAAASLATKPSSLLTYAGEVVHCINTNSLKVFGRKYIPSFQAPSKYTGELIGVDYLLAQTGQPLQRVDPDAEATDQLLEEVNVDEQEDEGFEEDLSDDRTLASLLEDLTTTAARIHPAASSAPPAAACSTAPPSAASSSSSSQPATASSSAPPAAASSSQPVATSSTAPPSAASSSLPAAASSSTLPSTPSSTAPPAAASYSAQPAAASTDMSTAPPGISAPDSPTQVPEETLAVDDQNVPGMDRVDSLADYLVELRHQTGLTLSSQQVSEIVALWQNLLDFDKQRVVFAARHQERLTTGRFRSPKKKAVFTPGVESLKRCVLASTASPAQWPDCCRLVEAIFIRLCRIHKNPRRKGKGSLTRWSLILHDYRRIRQLILNNGAIIQGTNLQLVEVNQTTLVQWHNERVKRQDLTLLLQGMDLPDPLPVAAEPLQSASARPAAPPSQGQGQEHAYSLPHNTVGQARQKRRITSTSPPDPRETARPKLAPQRQLLPRPPGAFVTLAPHPSPTYTVFVVPGPSATTTPQPSSTPPSVVLQPPQASSIPPATAVQPQMPRRPRAYTRRVEANTCKKCGRHRTAETGHSQYKGTIYCPNTETLTKEQWLEQIKKK